MAKNKWFGTDGVRGIANVFPMNADFSFREAFSETSCGVNSSLTNTRAKIPAMNIMIPKR